MPVKNLRRYTGQHLAPGIAPELARKQFKIPVANLTNVPIGCVMEEATTTQNTIWSISGTPGVAFTLTFRDGTTASLGATATATQIKDALNALPQINGAITAASGGPIATGAVLLTFGAGSAMANSPIELPTASAVLTITHNQLGSQAGTIMPSPVGSSNARFLNIFNFSTDTNGEVTFGPTNSGMDMRETYEGVPVYFQGYFKIEDLPLAAITGITGGYLNAAKVTELGKITEGTLAAAIGILKVG